MTIAGREISARTVGAVAGVIVVLIAVLFWRGGRGLEDPGAASRIRAAIDAETGTVFERFKIKDGDAIPWKNPKTGKRTLYPAEKCFWTAEGTFRDQPTYVLLNELVGRPGPTICPDCGRLVVPHNPLPPLPGEGSRGTRDRIEEQSRGG